MKKIKALLLMVVFGVIFSTAAPAQEFELNGFARSGVYWEKWQNDGMDPVEDVRMHSKDDAGDGQGRLRMDVNYSHGNVGLKTRIQWDNWGAAAPSWAYAFGYGKYFDEQITMSIGKLGASPWGTGGPEMWKELEISSRSGGMRLEVEPKIIPGLNAGFVLNYFNHPNDQGWPSDKPLTIMEVLKETVVGAAYTHELFLARFAFRFDSEYDRVPGNGAESSAGEQEYVFRIEEHILDRFLPGFSIWVLGYGIGLGAEDKGVLKLENWLFTQYDPDYFTAQIRFGYDYIDNRSILHIKPSFYYKFFNNLINAGLAFYFAQDFGEGKQFEGSPFYEWQVEPKIQLNFSVSSYITFVYNFGRKYVGYYGVPDRDPIRQTQWMNLRYGVTF